MNENEKILVFALAALFNVAKIINNGSANAEGALNDAATFVSAAKSRGAFPELPLS